MSWETPGALLNSSILRFLPRISARPNRQTEVEALKAGRSGAMLKVEPQESMLAAIRSAMPDDGILVSGMTQLGYYSRARYPVYDLKAS